MGADCFKSCQENGQEDGEVIGGDHVELKVFVHQEMIPTQVEKIEEAKESRKFGFVDSQFPFNEKSLFGKAYLSKDPKLKTLL